MSKLTSLLLGFLLISAKVEGAISDPIPSTTVSFMTEDSIWVFADLYMPNESTKSSPILLLLHQSASNSYEYLPMIPSFMEAGFICLAVDARGGGQNYGRHNRTNANLPHHGGGPQAYYDFKAALNWLVANDYAGKVTIIGSSYSAGRMFMVLAEKPMNVVAAAAFSPGRAFARSEGGTNQSWAERVEIPIYMTWSPTELDDEKRTRFNKVKSTNKMLYEQQFGTHAASTLRPDKSPKGYSDNLKSLLSFLDEFSK